MIGVSFTWRSSLLAWFLQHTQNTGSCSLGAEHEFGRMLHNDGLVLSCCCCCGSGSPSALTFLLLLHIIHSLLCTIAVAVAALSGTLCQVHGWWWPLAQKVGLAFARSSMVSTRDAHSKQARFSEIPSEKSWSGHDATVRNYRLVRPGFS